MSERIDVSEAYDLYDDFLDSMSVDDVCSYPTSYILKEVDPIAYDTGFDDFCDAEDIEIVEGS
jgi:hypothetical protein